jgi:SOS response regulatory protein OraA/RecX
VSFLKFKSARRKGVLRFRKELLDSGLSEEQIDLLTGQYEEIGRLRNYINLFESFRGSG